MFVSISGIAHDVKPHGPVMLFVDSKGRIDAGPSGCAVVAKDFKPVLVEGKPQMPDAEIAQRAAKGFKPAKMEDVDAAFIKGEVAGGSDEKSAKAAFAKLVMKA